ERRFDAADVFARPVIHFHGAGAPVGDQQVAPDVVVHAVGSAAAFAGYFGKQAFVPGDTRGFKVIRPQLARLGLGHDQHAVVGVDGDAVAELVAAIDALSAAVAESAVDFAGGAVGVGTAR